MRNSFLTAIVLSLAGLCPGQTPVQPGTVTPTTAQPSGAPSGARAPAGAAALPPRATSPHPIATRSPAPDQQFSEIQLLESAGWMIGRQARVGEWEPTPAQLDALLRGFALAINGKDAPIPIAVIGPRVSFYMQNRIREHMEKLEKAAKLREAGYFDELRKHNGVQYFPSGLCYEIIAPGADPKPAVNDLITVKYTGSLTDGTVFYSTAIHNKGQPATLSLRGVIPGLAEGLKLIGPGGKIKLYVPNALAYGQQPQPGVPSFSTLVFEIELVSVAPRPEPPRAPILPMPPRMPQSAPSTPPGVPIPPSPPKPSGGAS